MEEYIFIVHIYLVIAHSMKSRTKRHIGTAKFSSKRVKFVSFFKNFKLDNFCLDGCLCLH